jgi:hypothetical protein
MDPTPLSCAEGTMGSSPMTSCAFQQTYAPFEKQREAFSA